MSTDTSLDDPFLPLAFSLTSSPGAYAVLAGTGVSRGAGLPTAWDIVVDLVKQMAQRVGETDMITADTAEAWYETKYGTKPTYSHLIEQLALTPSERQALLQRYFEQSGDQSQGSPGPSVAHRAIARLMQAGVIRVVMTLNFDRLFEQALQDLSIAPTIVATGSDARGLGSLHMVQHCIIHLHGDYLNAISMRNVSAELRGYERSMKALLKRVVTDYGLLVAGWSVQHDDALREIVAAHYPSRYTMVWVEPGPLNAAASALIDAKNAVLLKTTADNAFGHFADEVEAIRERESRHPLTLAVAVSRIKRELSNQSPAIGTHDMLAGEFTRLRDNSAFHLADYNDTDNGHYLALLRQVRESSKILMGSVATLAYWGTESTDKWWLPEIERFAHPTPVREKSGAARLLDLPLIAASLMFYAAGVAAVAAQRFDLMAQLFRIRGSRTGKLPESVARLLEPAALTEVEVTALYEEVAQVVHDALALGSEPVDVALQRFEVLRLAADIMDNELFAGLAAEYAECTSQLETANQREDPELLDQALANRDRVVGRVADLRRVRRVHILATEQAEPFAGSTWRSPIAERLAEEVGGTTGEDMRLRLGLMGVSVAVGRRGSELSLRALPPGGGMPPQEIWLDTEEPAVH